MKEQVLTNGSLVYKYGFEKLLDMVRDHCRGFSTDVLKLDLINSMETGLIKFNFLITDEDTKNKLKDIEETLDRNIQMEIYKNYTNDFMSHLMDFFNKEIDIVKKEFEEKNPDIKYRVFSSQVSIFKYLKNSGILILEILI